MQTHTFFAAAASLAALALAVPAATANHIDFFTDGDGSALVLLPTTPGGQVSSTFTGPNATILGTTRFTQLDFDPGLPAGIGIAAQINVAGGQLTYSNDAATQGTLVLRYGDVATLDVVSNGTNPDYAFFRIDVADLGQSLGGDDTFTANVTALDTDGNVDTATVTIDAETDFFVPYSAFTGVDLSSLDTLRFEFVSGNLGADLILDEITREVVPEPTTAGLIGVATMGLLARRRRA